jgi:hypothetical protein
MLFYLSLKLELEGDQGDQMSLRKNRPKYSPNPFWAKTNAQLLLRAKVTPKFCKILQFSKTAQRKQSPNMRKFDQSGHPEGDRVIRHQ